MLRILMLLLLLPVFALATDGRGHEGYIYPSRWGEVHFDHWRHQSRVGDCRTCHHLGVSLGKCSDCHGVIEKLPQLVDVQHKTCINCHWKRKGPTECGGCHDPQKLDESVYGD